MSFGSYVPGGQAEYVRIPYADVVLLPIPDEVSDEKALFAGDILATGYACVEESGFQSGDTAIVIGGGPVGLMTALCAQAMGAQKVYIMESNKHRHEAAAKIGAIPFYPYEQERIRTACGPGPDVVFEAVGKDETLLAALRLVRPKGTVVCAGAHHSKAMPFNTEQAFAKEITLQFIVGNPIKYGPRLLEWIRSGVLDPTIIISIIERPFRM